MVSKTGGVKFASRIKTDGFYRYTYRAGFSVNARIDYEKFLDDVMKYADVDIDDIKTEEDLKALFDKAKKEGFNFKETEDSRQALVTEYLKRGKEFEEEEKEERPKKSRKEKKNLKRKLVKVHGKGKRLTDKEKGDLIKRVRK